MRGGFVVGNCPLFQQLELESNAWYFKGDVHLDRFYLQSLLSRDALAARGIEDIHHFQNQSYYLKILGRSKADRSKQRNCMPLTDDAAVVSVPQQMKRRSRTGPGTKRKAKAARVSGSKSKVLALKDGAANNGGSDGESVTCW